MQWAGRLCCAEDVQSVESALSPRQCAALRAAVDRLSARELGRGVDAIDGALQYQLELTRDSLARLVAGLRYDASSRGLGGPTGPLDTPSRTPCDPLQIEKVPQETRPH